MLNTVNIETRRKSARTKVASNEIIYLHFQTGNGAVALDASSEGFGFQAADPLEPNESLPFRLSVPGFPEIALFGQIVWLDSSRKRGGLSLRVPAESSALFGEWQHKYLDSAPGNEEYPSVAQAAPEAADPAAPVSAGVSGATAQAANAAASEGQTPQRQPVGQAELPLPNPPPPLNPFARRPDAGFRSHGPIFVSEWELPPEPPRTGRNILVAAVILALCVAVAGGGYYLAGKRELGGMLINLGRKIGGVTPQAATRSAGSPTTNAATPAVSARGAGGSLSSPQSSQAPVVPNPAGNAPPPSGVNRSQPLAAPAVPQSHAASTAANPNVAAPGVVPPTAPPQLNVNSPGAVTGAYNSGQVSTHNGISAAARPPALDSHQQTSSAASAGAQTAPPASAAANNGSGDLKQALQYLRSPDSQDSAVAAEMLWSAIGKGNTQAELVLGGLYLRGQGAVHRNCQQAKVLLRAALAANVPGADQQIQELQTYGCR